MISIKASSAKSSLKIWSKKTRTLLVIREFIKVIVLSRTEGLCTWQDQFFKVKRFFSTWKKHGMRKNTERFFLEAVFDPDTIYNWNDLRETTTTFAIYHQTEDLVKFSSPFMAQQSHKKHLDCLQFISDSIRTCGFLMFSKITNPLHRVSFQINF